MKCLKLIPFVFCLWLSSLQAYANSLHDAASEPCDLKALKKEMGAAYPEDFMSVAFDKPPYDRVYKQDISPAVLRPSFQGLLIANDSILDYIDIENFKIRTTPRGWITHFNSADIPSLRDRIKENYPDGLKTFHRYDETSLFMFVEDAPGKVNGASVEEAVDYLSLNSAEITRDTFEPVKGCEIIRERKGYDIYRTISISHLNLKPNEVAQCLATSIFMHYGLSNAKNLYARKDYISEENGKYKLEKEGLHHHYLYYVTPEIPGLKTGYSQCQAAKYVLKRDIEGCNYNIQRIQERRPNSIIKLSSRYIKKCAKLGVNLEQVSQ